MSAPFANPARIALAMSLGVLLSSCGGGGNSGGAPPPVPGPPPVNRSPVVGLPNANQQAIRLHAFNYDVSQNGRTFTDPDGDALRYEIKLPDPPHGLRIEGTHVIGVPEEVGFVAVTVTVSDPAGQTQSNQFHIIVAPNATPFVRSAPDDVIVAVNENINLDASMGGATFGDTDGDSLNYSVRLRGAPGLVVNGTRVEGRLTSVGVVEVTVTARDAYDGVLDDVFMIAAPAPTPGAPSLPATSLVYQDELLPLPFVFRMSSESQVPLFDRQTFGNRTTNAGATLGRVLFYDKRLSITNTIACASCHQQSHGFASSEAFNTGVLGIPLKRNSMALANARYNIQHSWFSDMRAAALQDVAQQAMQNSEEMGSTLAMTAAKVQATPFYAPLFEAAFGTPEVTGTRVLLALEQFVQALISYRSKFDRACSSMTNEPIDCGLVLDAQEMRGLAIFRGAGNQRCDACHGLPAGANVWQANNGIDVMVTDPGTTIPALQRDGSQGVFRPAALRNIALTAPYMHDGRFATLREVIDHYDHGVQDSPNLDSLLRSNGAPIRMNLSDADEDALEAFLRTLTDEEMIADPRFADPFQ
jgi:cytochrome c peroxidase